MIAYTMVGTNDIEKAGAFYDALLAEIGGKRIMEVNRVILWGGAEGSPLFCVAQPENGKPATIGNGCMTALGASSPEEVDRLHAKALELGASLLQLGLGVPQHGRDRPQRIRVRRHDVRKFDAPLLLGRLLLGLGHD